MYCGLVNFENCEVWDRPYLQTNKSACYSFTDTGGRQECSESETGLSLLTAQQAAWASRWHHFLLSQEGWHGTHSRLTSEQRSLSLGAPSLWYWTADRLACGPRVGSILILSLKASLCIAPAGEQRQPLSLSKLCTVRVSLKRTKAHLGPHSQACGNEGDPRRLAPQQWVFALFCSACYSWP